MTTSLSITRLFSAAMIAFLIITAGYVIVPAVSRVSLPITTTQGATSTMLTSAVLLPVSQSDMTIASTDSPLPGRGAGCTLCNSNPPADAIIVQLDAAPLTYSTYHAADVFSPAKTDAARTIAQRQPDPLERPPAA